MYWTSLRCSSGHLESISVSSASKVYVLNTKLVSCKSLVSFMDLLKSLNTNNPAPSKPLELTVKQNKVDINELKRAPEKQFKQLTSHKKPNNEYLKVQTIDKPIQHYKDQYGNTHMIVAKNDPLQVYGKQKKLPINTAQPIRIDHKIVVDKDEVKKWDIPPCVSNYKNPQGFVIPLDKRMASINKPEVVMNERFGEMASALYEADHKMKERLKDRRIQEQKVLKQQQQIIEHELQELTRNKKIMAGDKHIYDEFQQEQSEQRFKRKKPLKEEDKPLQYDNRIHFNTEDVTSSNINEILHQRIIYEKDNKNSSN
eukprot:NODE_396_length_9428_cov_0.525137.p4 type:complete len:313 gc:universal NODE_396_length_9428_cov_0.525137:3386-2448(-)